MQFDPFYSLQYYLTQHKKLLQQQKQQNKDYITIMENQNNEQNKQESATNQNTIEYKPLRSMFGEACLWIQNTCSYLLDLVNLGPNAKTKRTEEKAQENFDKDFPVNL